MRALPGSVNLILGPEAEHCASSAGNGIGIGLCALGDARPDGGHIGFAGAHEAVLRTGWIGADDEKIRDGDTVRFERVTEAAPVVESLNPADGFGDEAPKVILSLQNEIRELKGKPALKDVDELKVECRKTVVSSLNAPEEIRKVS